MSRFVARRPARALALVVAAALSVSLAACTGASASNGDPSTTSAEDDLLTKVQEQGYIDIGVFNNAPQSNIDPATGDWVGIDAEIAAQVGEELGIEFRPHVYDIAAIITALTSGRIDVIDALAQTEERKEVVAFSEQPIWWSPVDIVVGADSPIRDFDDLEGKTIAVPAGSAQVQIARKVQEEYGAAEVKEYKDFNTAIADVAAGRADSAVLGRAIWVYGRQQNPDLFSRIESVGALSDEFVGRDAGVYYVSRKDGTERFDAAVSDALAAMQADGRAEEIFRKYGYDDPFFWTGSEG